MTLALDTRTTSRDPAVTPRGDALISIIGLSKHFHVKLGAFGQTAAEVHALDDFTLDIRRGETLSLVGESGCGKSTAGFTMLQIHKPSAGQVIYGGVDLAQLSEDRLRPYRRKLQVVFQDPYSTLNPRMTVGEAIAEPLLFHGQATRGNITEKVATLLGDVGLSPRFAMRYPHELSGGQRQRVVIARALACGPEFLVCDEAISALDVSVQAQIINLFQDLQERYGLTYLFIAHDLAVVRHISDRVAVMYLGRPAELGPKRAIFSAPLHPYTKALLSAVPEPDPARERSRKRQVLSGDVPSPLDPPPGCRFHTRCPLAVERCRREVPAWREMAPDHFVACHRVGEAIPVPDAA
ncbi:Oligopeptide transport ATP-binding protein OppF [Rubellimicrobium mesophilum DSM 19309]|uniref:Oligopeptide transport ATP-binding protein OppF n=1 Tax=Rubellimicrobium mesophilum DSM 19309 TaxID=442562 RepID=A0A017HIF1_9RHOB|nr:oligopeptide/dipeptide ABC transporter ATP-binding protein [Rubellimicrobium mesophilum]EYD74126.1 Oligopeptide transport ATP-binding protein OppF [Rubellimicrobium mesophilum DSM 19309]